MFRLAVTELQFILLKLTVRFQRLYPLNLSLNTSLRKYGEDIPCGCVNAQPADGKCIGLDIQLYNQPEFDPDCSSILVPP